MSYSNTVPFHFFTVQVSRVLMKFSGRTRLLILGWREASLLRAESQK